MTTISQYGWKDLIGNPVHTMPGIYQGSPTEWYAELQKLQAGQCGWPDGAVITRKGTICRALKVAGFDRCRSHIEKAKISRPNERALIHGRYSRYLPQDLREKFIEARDDADLLTIRDNVAVLESAMAQLLESLEHGGTRKAWEQLKETWGELQEAHKSEDNDSAMAALARIGRLISKGISEADKRKEITELTGQIVSAKRAEHGRLKDLHQMVSVERVLMMLNAYHIRVMELVPDEAVRYSLAERMAELVNSHRSPPALLAIPAEGNADAESV